MVGQRTACTPGNSWGEMRGAQCQTTGCLFLQEWPAQVVRLQAGYGGRKIGSKRVEGWKGREGEEGGDAWKGREYKKPRGGQ